MRLLAAAALLPLAACSFSSGDDGPGLQGTAGADGRSYAASGFDQVAVKGAGDVDVRVGPGFSVRAQGTPDQLDRLRIAVKGDRLEIGPRGHNWGSYTSPKVFVTLPRLAGVAIAGSGDVAVDRIDGGDFKGEIAGSGDLRVASAAVDTLSLDVGGAGSFTGAGTANAVKVSIAGSGDIKAPGLKARTAEVSIAGGGDVHLSASDHAKVSIAGGGDVRIDGGAKCEVSKMGGGTVTCAGG